MSEPCSHCANAAARFVCPFCGPALDTYDGADPIERARVLGGELAADAWHLTDHGALPLPVRFLPQALERLALVLERAPTELERREYFHALQAAAAAAATRLRLQLQGILQPFLALVLCVLAACAEPAPPCDPELVPAPAPGAPVESVWCPDSQLELVINAAAPCPVPVVQEALAVWSPLAFDVRLVVGPLPAATATDTITLSAGEVPGGRIGQTGLIRWTNKANISAEITVEACTVQLVAHELGHAFGFGHAIDDTDLMHEDLYGDSWNVSGASLEAYASTQDG